MNRVWGMCGAVAEHPTFMLEEPWEEWKKGQDWKTMERYA